MNIFVTDADPKISAANLDDKRVVKMVLESAQILSTVMHIYGESNAPYKKTHANHPSVLWTAEAKEHTSWLFEHFEALLQEYTARYKRQHKCADYLEQFRAYFYDATLPYPKWFDNCTTYKDVESTQLAYRLYMADKWENDKRIPTWYGERH